MVSEKEVSDYYEVVAKSSDNKLASTWIMGDLFALLNNKNLSIKKGVVKGIKFAGKAAISPLSLALTGGALVGRQIKRELGEQPIKRTALRKYNRKGISVL